MPQLPKTLKIPHGYFSLSTTFKTYYSLSTLALDALLFGAALSNHHLNKHLRLACWLFAGIETLMALRETILSTYEATLYYDNTLRLALGTQYHALLENNRSNAYALGGRLVNLGALMSFLGSAYFASTQQISENPHFAAGLGLLALVLHNLGEYLHYKSMNAVSHHLGHDNSTCSVKRTDQKKIAVGVLLFAVGFIGYVISHHYLNPSKPASYALFALTQFVGAAGLSFIANIPTNFKESLYKEAITQSNSTMSDAFQTQSTYMLDMSSKAHLRIIAVSLILYAGTWAGFSWPANTPEIIAGTLLSLTLASKKLSADSAAARKYILQELAMKDRSTGAANSDPSRQMSSAATQFSRSLVNRYYKLPALNDTHSLIGRLVKLSAFALYFVSTMENSTLSKGLKSCLIVLGMARLLTANISSITNFAGARRAEKEVFQKLLSNPQQSRVNTGKCKLHTAFALKIATTLCASIAARNLTPSHINQDFFFGLGLIVAAVGMVSAAAFLEQKAEKAWYPSTESQGNNQAQTLRNTLSITRAGAIVATVGGLSALVLAHLVQKDASKPGTHQFNPHHIALVAIGGVICTGLFTAIAGPSIYQKAKTAEHFVTSKTTSHGDSSHYTQENSSKIKNTFSTHYLGCILIHSEFIRWAAQATLLAATVGTVLGCETLAENWPIALASGAFLLTIVAELYTRWDINTMLTRSETIKVQTPQRRSQRGSRRAGSSSSLHGSTDEGNSTVSLLDNMTFLARPTNGENNKHLEVNPTTCQATAPDAEGGNGYGSMGL